MKKPICLWLAICLLTLCGCTTAPKPTTTSVLTDKGLELIAKVDRLAECEEYITLFSTGDEIAAVIRGIGEQDYTDPKGVFVIENLDALYLSRILSETELPEDIVQMLRSRSDAALPTQITAMHGAATLAAASLLNYWESFLCEGLQSSAIYLYTYGNGYCFMVTYSPNDEGIVHASVSAVINEQLSECAAKGEVDAFFEETLYFPDVSASAVAAG